ncbi:MAG TPA: preprotein translocase subunit SecG [Candidatus Acidoferrales bacterium]|nr:preprotein translocase subunit SecG [Candidatus Acidoferrales bacterium]
MPSQAKGVIAFAVGAGLIFAGWKVPILLTILHVILCFLLILVVLLQSGKAADLAGAFGGAGSQTAFGPRGAATFLSKSTTWCAVMFMLTSFAVVVRQERQGGPVDKSVFQNVPAKQEPAPSQPASTTPAPPPQPTPPPVQQTPPAQQNPPAKQ